MSASPINNLKPNFGSGPDNFFRWNDDDPYKGSDPSIGYDIDKKAYMSNGVKYGDYDEFIQPHLSGDQMIVPDKFDAGHREYVVTETDDGRVYNLKDMLDLNQQGSLDDMIVEGNGRVGDADKPIETPTYIKQSVNLTMVNDNSETSIKGLLEGNAVNSIFFSEMNVKVLQNALRYGVYKKTGKIIGEQSPQELYVVMRSIMLQYANFQAGSAAVLSEVQRLNTKVLLYCIDNVSVNVAQQLKYIEELKTLPTPIDRPAYVEHPKNLTYDISNLL